MLCDGIVHCAGSADEKNCKALNNRFICKAVDGRINIAEHEVCNGLVNCLDGSDEMNCTRRFQCSSQNGEKVGTHPVGTQR